MAKIVTMGELLMRLSVPEHLRFLQARQFDINFGGGEANVAAALAMYGHTAEYVTKLPDNAIAHNAVGFLRSIGVNTNNIAFGGKRMGIYFLENGAASRPSGVIYDRAGSAFAEAETSDFDFDKIFADADLFHISGITPAISACGAQLAETALKTAKEKGITISFDINYRSKLWSVENAARILPNLLKYADICFANSWDAANLLDTDVPENAPFEEGARAMAEKYGFRFVAASKRVHHSASANDYSAMLYSHAEDKVYSSSKYTADPIIDRVGTGDAFSAGILCGLLDGKDCRNTVEFGAASAVLKHTVIGDICCASRAEVEALAEGGSTAIKR